MATDVEGDLHRPLRPPMRLGDKLAAWWPTIEVGLKHFTRIGGGILALILVALMGWVFFIEDPLGGEPQSAGTVQVATNLQNRTTDPLDGLALREGGSQPLPPATSTPTPGGPQVLRVPQPQPVDPSLQNDPGAANVASNGPRFDSRGGLEDVADPRLVDRFDTNSFVPRIGPNGERPLDLYARPVEAGTVAPGQPRIAIIVGGLGLSQTSTQNVIDRLPPETTLSFAPYGSSLSRWASRARQDGHEYLLEVPMEPFDYPNNDPGPHTLQVGLSSQANLERFRWALSRLPTPVGMMNYMGARFTSEEASLAPVLEEAASRGLMVVDDGRSARNRTVPLSGDDAAVVRADVVIDARASDQAINDRLRQLENTARERGYAVGVATALPLTIDTLEEWADSLADKGIALVPASSIVRF